MIAAVCEWHEFHEAALAEISNRLDRGEFMVTAAHALVEMYSVLTRLPSPHRLSPADALTLTNTNYVEGAKVVALSATDYANVIKTAAKKRVAGGRTYDALIVAAAIKAKTSAILTFNTQDFADLIPNNLSLVIPE